MIIEIKNQTAKIGDNITFICAASKTPEATLFWYYLNTTVDLETQVEDFVLIDNEVENNKNKYQISTVRSPSDPNENFDTVNKADRETKHLEIYNIDENDMTKAYLCIISNLFSHRISRAYLARSNESSNQLNEKGLIKKYSYMALIIVIAVSVSVAFIIVISIFVCLHLKYQKNFYKCCINTTQQDKMFLSGNGLSSSDTANSAHGSLQKGFEAMKNNFLYPYIPHEFNPNVNSNESSKRSYYINDVLQTNSNSSTTSEKQLLNSIDSHTCYDIDYVNMIQQLIDDKEYLIPFEK